LKWVWFAKRARPLSDLKVFDNASRGIYGSVELVWALRMRYVSNSFFVSLSCLRVVLMDEGEGILRSWVRLQSCSAWGSTRLCRTWCTTRRIWSWMRRRSLVWRMPHTTIRLDHCRVVSRVRLPQRVLALAYPSAKKLT
jgi:hypothetical protein